MKRLIGPAAYVLSLAAIFYLLPLLMTNILVAMFLLLFFYPLLCGGFSLFFVLRCKMLWLCPLLTAVLFAPTLVLFYNETAWVYIPVYAACSLLGGLAGWMIRRMKVNKKFT